MELMGLYIEQGRFGEFVAEILNMEYQRRMQTLEKEENDKLWIPYLLNAISGETETYMQWKSRLKFTNDSKKDIDMDMTEDMQSAILNELFGGGDKDGCI